jgi:5-methylcytosine-specific restriction endonuclease McrA
MALNSRQKRRLRLAKAQKKRCYYCGCRMTFRISHNGALPPTAATFEHIIPVSQGGSSHSDNLVIACFSCNNARGDRDARDMMLTQMGLLK